MMGWLWKLVVVMTVVLIVKMFFGCATFRSESDAICDNVGKQDIYLARAMQAAADAKDGRTLAHLREMSTVHLLAFDACFAPED